MEAARAAAFAGARVTLFEAGDEIGGQFLLAGAVPGKDDFAASARSFARVLAELGVEVRAGRAAHADDLGGFDHVVVATGVVPRPVALPGVERTIDYVQAFADVSRVGERVAIIGAGGIAVDLAHLLVEGQDAGVDGFLIENGLRAGTLPPPRRQVTIMRRSGAIGAGMGATTRWAAVQAIRRRGARTLTGVTYRAVEPGGVRIEVDGVEELIEADTVIVAAGQTPRAQLTVELSARGIAHTVVGGARNTAGLNAVAAFEEGLRAGDAAARAGR
jgi:2,4-dienoyl-CoA reductase (NADPH2)